MTPDIDPLGTSIRNFIENTGKDPSPPLPAEEQTKLSWARVAKSTAEVPEVYRSFFDALPASVKEPFPYSVISPTYKGFLRPENEKLICRIGNDIHVLDYKEHRLIPICYPLTDIVLIETGTILLYSWYMINGKDNRGELATSRLVFNSVTEHLFSPFLEGFRSAARGGAGEPEAGLDTSPFDGLTDTHFKLMNYARKSIRPGEKVVQILLQPEIRQPFFSLAGLRLSRQITPAHLTILTDSELILIREDNSPQRLKERPYGGIWRYIPINKIASFLPLPTEKETLVLQINLDGKGKIESVFDVSQRAQLDKMRRQIRGGAVG